MFMTIFKNRFCIWNSHIRVLAGTLVFGNTKQKHSRLLEHRPFHILLNQKTSICMSIKPSNITLGLRKVNCTSFRLVQMFSPPIQKFFNSNVPFFSASGNCEDLLRLGLRPLCSEGGNVLIGCLLNLNPWRSNSGNAAQDRQARVCVCVCELTRGVGASDSVPVLAGKANRITDSIYGQHGAPVWWSFSPDERIKMSYSI